MELALHVRKTGPDGESQPRTYAVDVPREATVLDALLQAREAHDPSLAFRGNCMRGLCGDCAMEINGDGVLACTTRAEPLAGKPITVQPIRRVPVIRDLAYDMESFLWSKIKAVRPWIVAAGDTEREASLQPSAVEDLQKTMSCFSCGLCDEGCTVIAVDRTFLGPAALTKAYRLLTDPRATGTHERLAQLERPGGIWDCTHCFEANGHCPRGIQPTDRILAMRDMAKKSGITHRQAARHHNSFLASVRGSGWLDEGRLAVESVGWTNLRGLLRLLPTALRALRRGKAPLPYLHKKRPGAERLKRIIDKVRRHAR